MSLADGILEAFIGAPCPQCGYVLEIQMIDALTQVWRWCPCCRCRIRLVDAGGSVYKAREDIDRAIGDLEKEIKRLFG